MIHYPNQQKGVKLHVFKIKLAQTLSIHQPFYTPRIFKPCKAYVGLFRLPRLIFLRILFLRNNIKACILSSTCSSVNLPKLGCSRKSIRPNVLKRLSIMLRDIRWYMWIISEKWILWLSTKKIRPLIQSHHHDCERFWKEFPYLYLIQFPGVKECWVWDS